MASRPRAVRTGRAAAQLGAQLAALREQQDLSVDQLAERSNLSRATVRRVEGGDPGVGLGTFLTVVKTLGHLDALHAALEPDDLT
ncbi:helix-turn-helix domain-containing protein [Microlunatus flavus]|uniref:Helix-turn-helix domain-containing protein n=1 Tax=Microlunatus flavus TaxID=1036181 RepID=A0A1H9C8K6_9ACTN|nr:helix-turn-helix transcriptional regulator [Microlunatus flavus]SEP97311.1 Helix-turn-helix domain-containing protein [Microlunatus flavus]